MINSQFKLRIERLTQQVHDALRTRAISESAEFTEILKKNQSCYLSHVAGADWNCTIGLMDPLYEEHNQIYDGLGEWRIDIILRHKTNEGLFTDISLLAKKSGNEIRIDQIVTAMVSNMQTHVEFEELYTAVNSILQAVPNLDFSTAKVIFGKRNPEAP